MRLTLRTLLAWLDDTLPASEVRQIGKQVAESPFAQELVDRTYRVTRQRRLLVPGSTGADATDPNLVATYLDNELPPDDVTEYEKRCLTSDVNLAEVASVHQILSLIGQKAKVPPESRHRMYRLVKGREAVANTSARAFRVTPAPPEVAVALSPWSPPSPPKRPLGERVGLGSLVLVLLCVIGWTAYNSLRPESAPDAERVAFRMPVERPVAATPFETKPDAQAEAASRKAADEKAASLAVSEKKASDSASPEGVPKVATSASKATTIVPGDGVAVGWNREKGEWTRLVSSSPIKDETRILNFAPFWTTLQIKAAQVVLVGEAEATISGGDSNSALRLGFVHGRAILKGGEPGVPYKIILGERTLSIANAPATSIGLQRTWTLSLGGDFTPSAALIAYVPEGEATLQSGAVKQTVRGPSVISMGDKGELKALAGVAVPAWVVESGPSPAEKQLGDRFLKFFSPTGSVLRDLVQAVDGDDQDVRRLAIRGLGAVGDAEMIVPVLNNASTDPATRRAAVDVLRSMLARGGDAAKGVRSELKKVFGIEWADDMEKMLLGFTPEEEKREALLGELVQLLNAPELGTRELAIQALMAQTKRDNLEYDPVKPEGRGLKAWQDLIRKREPAKSATPPAGTR